MRILFLSTDFKPATGGIAEFSYQVCSELAARGHELNVLTYRMDRCPKSDASELFTVRRTLARYPAAGARSLTGIYRCWAWAAHTRQGTTACIHDLRPEIVLAGNHHKLWPTLLPWCGRPYCVFMHGEDLALALASHIPLRRRRLANMLHRAAWVFCNSAYSLSLVHQVCKRRVPNACAVGCGFPLDRIVTEDHRAEAKRELGWSDAPVLLTVARVVRRKGIDTVIKALRPVLVQEPACRYVVVGDGPDGHVLQRLVKELKLQDHVEFLGHVSEEVKRRVYLGSDLYVMPSRPGRMGETEGFGISFLEANAYRLAVIGSRAGGIRDAVNHGENGLLVDPYDVAALAQAIITLLRAPRRCQEMAQSGQRRIRERFNWASIVDQIERQLAEAVRG